MSDSYHCNSPRVENSNYLGIQSFKDVFCIATISGGQAQFRYNSRFFVLSYHPTTYQNHYGPSQRSQNSGFPSHFSASKIKEILLIFFSLKKTGRPLLWNFWFSKCFKFLKLCPIFVGLLNNFDAIVKKNVVETFILFTIWFHAQLVQKILNSI